MATAPSSRRHIARRGRYALAAIAAAAAIALIAAAFTLPGRSPGRAFPTLAPAAAPAGRPHLTLPNGTTGRTSASVLVGTSPAAAWAQASPLLLRAVAAYQVR